MSQTTKSPKKVVRTALRVAARVLTFYSHHMSPKKFTQPQLFACLVLKAFFKIDFRGICKYLTDMPDLRRAIGLKSVPHFTTLHKASQRLLSAQRMSMLLSSTLFSLKRSIPIAALDATGLQCGHISPYFYSVREKAGKNLSWSHFTQYPKLALIVDVDSHMILSAYPTRGPARDTKHFNQTLSQLPTDIEVQKLLADAGYDCEAAHVFAREQMGIVTVIPATASKGTPHKFYRRMMTFEFDNTAYRKRWQVETVFSMIKRNLGYTIHAKLEHNQHSEMLLLALTHNILITYLLKSFSTELDVGS